MFALHRCIRAFGGFAAIAAAPLLFGCAGPAGRLDSARELAIASDAAFAPFHFVDAAGQPTGHDIELARAVSKELGLTPRFMVVRPYADLLNGLLDRRYDVVAATTGVTPERQQTFLFSTPYFRTCQAVVVRRGPGEPVAIHDLAGRRVGYAGDGTSARAARGLPGVRPVRLDKGQAGIPALRAGEIDALVVDEFDAVAAARSPADPSQARLAVLPEPAALEDYALVLHPQRTDLKRRIDAALTKLQQNGSLSALRARFGLERGPGWPVRMPAESGAEASSQAGGGG